MINNHDTQEKEHIEIIRDSPKNKSRVTIEYQFDAENDKLGTGGYGEVYKVKKKRANMSSNDPEYALKIFNKVNFYKDNEKGSRILTEIKIHRSLNHEHIVKYEHSFEDKKNVYILMEYCGHGTLASLIKTRKFLEEYEIRYYMFQVLSVLKYFRREKIVHRDLTLGNIFLKDIKTVKIGDFGFAYKESENEEKAGVICGTPGYFTPESNNSKYSYKTDIFDFGLCIYYLFGGKLLFKTSLESAEFFTNKEPLSFEKKLNFSEEAIDLLKNTITLENQRYDLDKIYNHPFFNGGKGLSKDKFPEYNENNKLQFFKDLKELPLKEGLILNHKRNDQRNNMMSLKPNINTIIPPDIINSSGNKNINDLRNSSGQSGKNVSFNINDNMLFTKPIKINSNKKIITKLKDKIKEREKENSKNQNDFFENLTKTIEDQNQMKEIKEKEKENIEINNNSFHNNNDNNNTEEEIKIKKIKNKTDENNFDFNNTLAAVTIENEIESDKYKNKKLIYVDKIISQMDDNLGIGYKLNNKNIGVYFNDNSQLVKIYNNNKFIFYYSKGILQNTKEKLELPLKCKSNEQLLNKFKFLVSIINHFKNEIDEKQNEENINEEEDSVIIEKYKINKKVSLFILSNKNIQVDFNDKTKIIFTCYEPKKIIYIVNNEEKLSLPITNNNFHNFKCDDKEISNKIKYAINQINK